MRTLLAALALLAATPAIAAPPARGTAAFAARLDAHVRALRDSPHAPPGTVALVVHDGRTVFAQAYGVRDHSTGAPMTLDTPIYNASVTKAYTGLLAAQLDADGVLPLSASLRDVWPKLRLPVDVDPAAVTAARLLSHSSVLHEGGLVFRSVFTGQPPAGGVEGQLARHARRGRDGFAYANFGPYVWSAMAEARTGRPWAELLRRKVLSPMRLTRSSARTEELPARELARCHPRLAGAWQPAPPKPTALMNAAGGMFTSGRDAAAFINAFVTDGASAGGRIPAAVLRRTWEPQVAQDRTLWSMHRDGYGLGWDLGTIGAHRFVSRSGGYAGCRAISMFLPELKLGIVLMSNGDAAVNTLHAAILHQAIDLWTGRPDAPDVGAARAADYAAAAAQEVREADAALAPLAGVVELPAAWLDRLGGRYVNDRLGIFAVRRAERRLWLEAGAFRGELHPLERGEFALVSPVDAEVERIAFEFDGERVTGFRWDDDWFARDDTSREAASAGAAATGPSPR